MSPGAHSSDRYTRPLRRFFLLITVVFCLVLFFFWRIDNPRAEAMRAQIIDRVLPSMEWALVPVTRVREMAGDFRSYARLYEQNQELRRELRRMEAWKEAALQLEQQNAKLLDLNNVRLDPKFSIITAVVLADSGSPFRQSVLINIGNRDGVRDGWATMDGIGLVGRISGTGERAARVILLTDSNSLIPVEIQPSGQRAILKGDNSSRPVLDFIESPEAVRPGDRIVTSGDGGIFPANLLVGQVAETADRRLRATLAADYEHLNYLRVLRSSAAELISGSGQLLAPVVTVPLGGEPDGGLDEAIDAQGGANE